MNPRLALPLALGLVAALAACASPASTLSTGAATTASTAPSRSSPSSSSSSASCTTHAVAGDSANGSTVCVARGGDLTVVLHAPSGGSWTTPEATGAVLGTARPVPTPFGSVGWSLPATSAGTADVSTSRHVCPSAATGAVRCNSIVVYLLHVVIE